MRLLFTFVSLPIYRFVMGHADNSICTCTCVAVGNSWFSYAAAKILKPLISERCLLKALEIHAVIFKAVRMSASGTKRFVATGQFVLTLFGAE